MTAVVVLWNSGRVALELLRSLEDAFADGLRMVIVDNASADGSAEVVEAFVNGAGLEHAISLVRSGENLGFTGGVNLGADHALAGAPGPDYIWLLNPDARTDAATAHELVAVARESGAEIVGNRSKYLKTDAWPKPFFARPDGHWATAERGRWWEVGAYGGACVLFDSGLVRRLVHETGSFQDPGLFLYWDEWECALRAKGLGARVVMARDTRLEHPDHQRGLGRSASARYCQYYMARNGVAVSRRHMPAWLFWLVMPVRFGRDFSWMARVRLQGQIPHPVCYLEGTLDGLRGRMGRWRKHPASP